MSNLLTHAVVEGSFRQVMAGAVAVGRVNPHSTIEVTLKVRRKKALPALNGRPKKIMTREDLAKTYGANETDIKKVVESFEKFGLRCKVSNAATRTVDLIGTVKDMEEAFLVTLFNYTHRDGNYRGRVGNLHVPIELKDLVEGVFGLDNRRVARRRRTPMAHNTASHALTAVPSSWYKPSELAVHYSFPDGDGTDQCVAVLEFGGGYFESDLNEFCQLVGIAEPIVNPISVDGTATNSRDGSEGEVMLDIEVIAGVCPKATIAVYFAQFTERGWIQSIDAVTQDKVNNPSVVSVSWGYAEDALIWTNQAMTQINSTLQEAAHLGITVCVAAGDDGSSDGIKDGHAHTDFPSSSPYVISVGGTTIPVKGGTQTDIVWFEGDGLRQDNGGSTGGGVSAYLPRPTWQSGININSVNPGAIAGRIIPDISANADWNASPYLLVVDGGAQPNGGTSAATPLVAALFVLINQSMQPKRVGYVTPLFYGKTAAGDSIVGAVTCTEVVSGNNNTATVGGYAAGPGYNAASGWGTPNGQAMIAAFKQLI
jgi:kumamolisin